MNPNEILSRLETTLDQIKTKIAQNQGSANTIMEDLKKKFGVKTEEEADALLKKKIIESEEKTKQRDDLLSMASDKLKEYEDNELE